jgi:iron complex outermembrane receptor protein
MMVAVRNVFALALAASVAAPAWGQRAGENAVTSADDAFGTSVGNESIGLYSTEEVRGFSPGAAGNFRIDGLYLGGLFIGNPRLLAGTSVKVGLTAQGYPFPAPTGIVDISLRPAGSKPLLSAVVHGGIQNGVELDGQLPLSGDFSIAGGVGYSHYLDNPGGDYGNYWSVGIAPSWRPNKDTEVRAFYALEVGPKDVSSPYFFVDGPHLPPRVPHRFQGQHWAAWKNRTDTMGLFGHTALGGGWSLKAGLFRQRFESTRSFNTLFLDTAEDGASDFVVAIHPVRTTDQTAGEARLTRQLNEGPRRHELHLSVKGRARTGDFGGEQVVDFGPVTVGQIPPQFPKPDVNFGPETSDKTRQLTAGIAYHGIWPGVGEVGVGLQRTDYRKTIGPPDAPDIVTRAHPWLWNATLAVNLVRGLVAYGGYTKGLEDSGVAPEIAVNRSEAPPALLTSQRDIGLRYVIGPMRFVVGGFDVRKPYFNVDPNLIFRDLGTVRHRGIEISVAGEPVKGLNLVGGAVLMKPRVTGPAVDLGLIGARPVSQAETMITSYADYRLPFAPAFSVNLGVNYLGPRPGSADNLLAVPARTIVDLGGRYRFQLAKSPATLRLQLSNLTNQYAWDVTDFGGFRRNRPRSIQADLSVDF